MKAPLSSLIALCLISCSAWAQTPSAAPPSTTNAYFASYGMIAVDSEETAAALQEMVGDRAKLTYYKPNNKLLVYGPPEAHQLLREALRELNVPPRNVRIEVDFDEQRSTSATEVSVGASGGVVVTRAGVGGTVRITPRAASHTTEGTSQTRQQLLVRSGSEASLRVGEEVPFVNELIVWGRRYGYIAQEVTLRNVGASLVARAQIIGKGPLVQITLTPELSGVTTGRSRRIRFTHVATSLTVRDGEPIMIASFDEHADFYRLFLAGIGRTHDATSKQITLRVTIEAPANAAAPAPAK